MVFHHLVVTHAGRTIFKDLPQNDSFCGKSFCLMNAAYFSSLALLCVSVAWIFVMSALLKLSGCLLLVTA